MLPVVPASKVDEDCANRFTTLSYHEASIHTVSSCVYGSLIERFRPHMVGGSFHPQLKHPTRVMTMETKEEFDHALSQLKWE